MLSQHSQEIIHYSFKMPEIGYAYFDKTGIYFDYKENSQNFPENVIAEQKMQFVWTKADPAQREMNAITGRCPPGGIFHSIGLERFYIE